MALLGRSLPLAALLSMAGPLWSQNALPALQEEEAVLLMPLLNRQRLGDSMLSYPSEGRTLLPFGELCRALGLAIRVDAKQGIAEGYILQPNRGFRLDLSAQKATVEGRSITIPTGAVRSHAGEIYVDAALLPEWFPISLEADTKAAYFELKGKPGIRFPIEDVWEREKAYAKRGATQPAGDENANQGPHMAIPYALLDVPSIDLSTAWSVSGKGGSPPPSGSLAVAGDLLWMSAVGSAVRDSSGKTGNARLDLFREEPDGTLLGPLKATRVEFGDVIQKGGLDIVGGLPDGHGFSITNTPLSYSSTFGQRTFSGLLAEGWTVELYQNGSLLAYQRARPDGRFDFQQVPVRFGLNEFRLVFLGPHGERQEQITRVDIAGDRPKSGQMFYQVTALAPRASAAIDSLAAQNLPLQDASHKPALLGSLEYGLNESLSLKTSAMQVGLPQGLTSYTFAGLRTSLPFLAMQFGGISSQQPSGAGRSNGWQGDLRTGIGYSSLSLRHSEFQPGFTLSGSQTTGRYLRSESTADLAGSWGGRQVNLGLTGTFDAQRFWDSSRQDRNRLQLSTSLDPVNLMIFTGQTKDSAGVADSRETGIILSTNLMGFSAQGGLTTRKDPTTPSHTEWDLQAGFLGPWKLDYRLSFTQGPGGSDGRRLAATVTRLMGAGVGFGLESAWTKAGGVSLALRLQVSFQREPRRGSWIADSQAMSSSGAVSAVAFVDANGNGILDRGERVLEGTRFNIQAGGMGENRSQDPATVHVPLLGRGRWLPVELDTASLEDSSLQPINPILSVLPRPGKVSQVNFPVAVLGEINGTTRRRTHGRLLDLGGLELELIHHEKGVIKTLRTAFDGFYELRNLPLGVYELRVSEAEARRLKLVQPPTRKLTLTPERPIWDGMDLVINLTLEEDETPDSGALSPSAVAPAQGSPPISSPVPAGEPSPRRSP